MNERNSYHTQASGHNASSSSMHLEDSTSYLASTEESLWRRPKTAQEKFLLLLCCFLMALSIIFLISLCIVASKKASGSSINPRSEDDVCNTKACKETAVKLLASLNSSVDPCDNFYEYTCGGWVKNHPIPPSEARYSTFDLLRDEVAEQVQGVLKYVPTKKASPKAVLNAQRLFQGCMDEDSRETQGLQPLNKLLTTIGGWPMLNYDEWDGKNYKWYEIVADVLRITGTDSLLDFDVQADIKNTTNYIIYIDQPSFGMGRNQLVNLTSSNRTMELVAAYKKYAIKVAQLMNSTESDDKLMKYVDDMLSFESAIAQLSRRQEDRRDANSWYHKMTIADMQKKMEDPTVDWKGFMNSVLKGITPIENTTEIIVMEIGYLNGMMKVVRETDVKTVANYIGWRMLLTLGPKTTKEFRDADFRFDQAQLGIEEPMKLVKECVNEVNNLLGFASGRLYVEKYVEEAAKRDAEMMVEMLRTAYRGTITSNTWMDAETKRGAYEKLDGMVSKMAYPQWIKDDEKLDKYYKDVGVVVPEKFFDSMMNARRAIVKKALERWNKKTNRTEEWVTKPPVVNAFYNPSGNSITFPAGILNYPFYTYDRTSSVNFGAIGAVMGHEMSHGFDDQGSQYDKEGNLLNWWTDATKEKFDEKANCFREQYSNHVEPLTQMNLNGNNSVGENIADNGGVRNSFKAYRLLMAVLEDNLKNTRLPGIPSTPDQLFFLGYASVWCGSERKESLEMSIQYNSHSPNNYRVLVPLSNSKDFARAFNCPEGSRMNPKDKCLLW